MASDPGGIIAREESRRKNEQGIFEISEPNELLFSQVSKEVFTQVVPGLVVDFRPPLFNVSWSDGTEQLFVKKELDYFRRIHDKHIILAKKRQEQRKERILKAAAASSSTKGVNTSSSSTGNENCQQQSGLVPEIEQGTRSMLEWRLLEVAAAHSAKTKQNLMPVNNDQNNTQVQQPVVAAKVDTGSSKKGIIRVRNCPYLARGTEPEAALWLSGRASVAELYLVNCDMKPAPPAGIRALSSLEVLDLSKNLLRTTEPREMVGSAPQWAKDGNLRLLQKLNLRSNLLGFESEVSGILNSEALVWCCKQLKHLDMSDNPYLIALPVSISLMNKLEVLNAEHCALDRVTTGVWSCTSLTQLHLGSNKLKYLDDLDNYGIRMSPKIEKMKALTSLDISNNQIDEFPEDVWSLPCLNNLQIQGNPAITTPPSTLQVISTNNDGKSRSRSKRSNRGQSSLNSRDESTFASSGSSHVEETEEEKMAARVKTAVKAEGIGFLGEDWTPAPLKHCNLTKCDLRGLPLPLIAGAHTAFVLKADFELQRKMEILAESDDSSSEEEAEVVKKKNKKSPDGDNDVDDDEDNDEEEDDDDREEKEEKKRKTVLSSTQKKAMNARAQKKIEKKTAKKERRTRVAPLIGVENIKELLLSENRFEHFPCAVDSNGVTLLQEVSLLSCHFKSLVKLDLSRNNICDLSSEFFQHSKALTDLDLSFNQLECLPSELCECTTRLKSLMLDHNRLSHLPASLGQLQQLNKLTVTFNALRCLPDSASTLLSLHSIALANNDQLQPVELAESVKIGRRAVLRVLLGLPDSVSLSNRAEKYCPRESTTVRRLAGGVVAEDEAAIPPSVSEEEEEDEKESPPKPMKPPKSELLVYDHQGDLLDHATRESYLCKSFTLFYEVETVLPPKRPESKGGFQ